MYFRDGLPTKVKANKDGIVSKLTAFFKLCADAKAGKLAKGDDGICLDITFDQVPLFYS